MALCAQDAPASKPSAASKLQAPKSQPAELTVSLDFEGGTMAAFVAAVRKQQPLANIMLANNAKDAAIPAMELRGAGIEQALQGACEVAEADGEVSVKPFRSSGRRNADASWVFSIRLYPSRKSPKEAATGAAGQQPEEVRMVHSLRELTSDGGVGVPGYDIESILSVIDVALSAEQEKPSVQYHEASRLLLARGQREQLSMINDILQELGRELFGRQARARMEKASASKARGK